MKYIKNVINWTTFKDVPVELAYKQIKQDYYDDCGEDVTFHQQKIDMFKEILPQEGQRTAVEVVTDEPYIEGKIPSKFRYIDGYHRTDALYQIKWKNIEVKVFYLDKINEADLLVERTGANLEQDHFLGDKGRYNKSVMKQIIGLAIQRDEITNLGQMEEALKKHGINYGHTYFSYIHRYIGARLLGLDPKYSLDYQEFRQKLRLKYRNDVHGVITSQISDQLTHIFNASIINQLTEDLELLDSQQAFIDAIEVIRKGCFGETLSKGEHRGTPIPERTTTALKYLYYEDDLIKDINQLAKLGWPVASVHDLEDLHQYIYRLYMNNPPEFNKIESDGRLKLEALRWFKVIKANPCDRCHNSYWIDINIDNGKDGKIYCTKHGAPYYINIINEPKKPEPLMIK